MSTITKARIESLRVNKIDIRPELAKMLRRTYYSGVDDRDFETDEVMNDLHDHVYRRYERTLCHYIPWVMNCVDLTDKVVIEIGSGTGSSTAAFAPFCKHIDAYEIAGPSACAGRARMQLMEITNVSVIECHPERLLDQLEAEHSSGVPVILLFAVLEHMTIDERLTTLKRCWKLLSPGGIIIVAETPNRLTFDDYHTSWLPFFHMLPPDLAMQYYHRSSRSGFTSAVGKYLANGDTEGARMALVRWGNGVSFHEFELTFGSNLAQLLIADGDAEEMRSLYPVSLSEKLLRQYFIEAKVNQPIAFTNQILNLIFQKVEN